MDLTDALERSIPAGPTSGPELPLPVDRLSAGRRLRRRRRLAAGGAALAVGVVLAGGVSILDRPADEPAAADHPRTSSTDPSGEPTVLWRTQDPIPQFAFDGQAFYDLDGELVVRDGAEEVQRVDNPAGVSAPAQSVGLVTRWQGDEYWTFAWGEGDDASSTSVAVGDLPAPAAFSQWLADLSARNAADYYEAAYASLSAEGTLVPAGAGTTVVAQTSDPDGAATAVGIVTVGDARLCVAAAGSQVVYLSAREHGPDLAGCVDAFRNWVPDAG